ncbi:MAG: hypothetical protein M3380_10055 [Chloroflexota bacterium]|nr:hypothetical protein [Chloroflexota bacterium]
MTMQAQPTTSPRGTQPQPSDRWSWLWLALATVLGAFVGGRWNLPWAAWLGPVVMLRFVRRQPPLRGYLLGTLANAVGVYVAWQGIAPIPGSAYYGFVAGTSRVSRHGWDRADLKCTEGPVERITTLVVAWCKRIARAQSLHFCTAMALARDPGDLSSSRSATDYAAVDRRARRHTRRTVLADP